MLARANDLARLEQALRPPKARGGFGELLLENLLRDRLPPAAYEIQHTFSSGDRVDAVVRAGRLLSVDSKFPLENFERLTEAPTDEERQLHQRAFSRDVRDHVDAISTKYIRPEDGTYDFAFMYVPVEAVYYELACGPSVGLQAYAHEKRVFFVSPTTFTAYLQVIVLGLRGMQIEEHASEVLSYVAELGKDFGRFKEDFELVGTHLGRAQSKFADADKRLDKFAGKLERASEDRQPELDAPRAASPGRSGLGNDRPAAVVLIGDRFFSGGEMGTEEIHGSDHHRRRPCRVHRGALRRPRRAAAARDRGVPVGRPADAHERRRELPGLPGRDHGPRDDAGLPPPGRAVRRAIRHRGRDRRSTSRRGRSGSRSRTTNTAHAR